MEMKYLLSVIDEIQSTIEERINITESTNRLSQYMEMIAESKVDEKISFHHTGNRSSMKKHLKQSHGLTKSIRTSSSKGAKHFLKDESNPTDIISLDVPLLIRLLEYAREDAQDDMDLHNVAEQLINLSKDGNTLTMDNYDSIVGDQEQLPPPSM